MIKNNFQVDCILTSPPYNTVRSGDHTLNEKARENGYGRYDVYQENMDSDEYINWTITLFKQFNNVLSPNGVVLYNLSYGNEDSELMWRVIYNILEHTNFTIADNIIWKKPMALPNGASPNKLIRLCEYIYVFCRKEEYMSFNTNKQISKIGENGQTYYHSIYNYIEAPNNDGSNHLNKATFSTELVCQLMDIYVANDMIVYDPFMGTGTTANACKSKGIKYIGSEISKAQVEYATNRLKSVQTRLI